MSVPTVRTIDPGRQAMKNSIRDTILQVEQMIHELPTEGTKVELITTTKRTAPLGKKTTQDYVKQTCCPEASSDDTSPTRSFRFSRKGEKKERKKEKKDKKEDEEEVWPPVPRGPPPPPPPPPAMSPTVSKRSAKRSKSKPQQLLGGKAEIVPGSMTLKKLGEKPGGEMAGCIIDVAVRVKRGDSTQLLEMSIECPEFVPKRILFEGKWLKIVDVA